MEDQICLARFSQMVLAVLSHSDLTHTHPPMRVRRRQLLLSYASSDTASHSAVVSQVFQMMLVIPDIPRALRDENLALRLSARCLNSQNIPHGL